MNLDSYQEHESSINVEHSWINLLDFNLEGFEALVLKL